MKKQNTNTLTYVLFGLLALMLLSPDLMASTSGLPWEGPLMKMVDSIKGPVAFGVSVIAIVAAGAGLIFGGEIGTFMKSAIILALIISLIVFAVNILSTAFGIGSALILVA
ncbi:MAG: TrbC/VirB2 family protein [Campylobacterales bacterium]|nr:TrbC/VirB2 family protein [Campylobacterales bacterium]